MGWRGYQENDEAVVALRADVEAVMAKHGATGIICLSLTFRPDGFWVQVNCIAGEFPADDPRIVLKKTIENIDALEQAMGSPTPPSKRN